MDTARFLEDRQQRIVDEGTGALARAGSPHYLVPSETRRRLQALLIALIETLDGRDVGPIVAHAQYIAKQRYDAGFDLGELQTAFNVLEEIAWTQILAEMQPADQAEALGLVSTALGAGKDALARTYVSLATQKHSPSLDLSRLFAGT